MASFFRYILFCVFFAAGTGAIAFSLLVGEIDEYYRNSDALEKSEAENKRLEKLDSEYNLQLKQFQNDPNVVSRLNRLTTGEQPVSEDTVYPTASADDISKAGQILNDNPAKAKTNAPFRKMVTRCKEKNLRLSLFVAGAGLIAVTFIFFGRSKPKTEET